jgi:hypothetical protein
MKTISVYSKSDGYIIINVDYIVTIKKVYYEYGMGKHDYIISTENGRNIIVEEYHFEQVKEKFKEMGVCFDNEK